jgi:hypothetical protein
MKLLKKTLACRLRSKAPLNFGIEQEDALEPEERIPRYSFSGARIDLQQSPASHREKDGGYPVVLQIGDELRVISCKDDLQWIVQSRYGAQWRVARSVGHARY